MLDFFNIEKYKENNRLEAKAAAVGLPKSFGQLILHLLILMVV